MLQQQQQQLSGPPVVYYCNFFTAISNGGSVVENLVRLLQAIEAYTIAVMVLFVHCWQLSVAQSMLACVMFA